jgi:hypothetical protein
MLAQANANPIARTVESLVNFPTCGAFKAMQLLALCCGE